MQEIADLVDEAVRASNTAGRETDTTRSLLLAGEFAADNRDWDRLDARLPTDR